MIVGRIAVWKIASVVYSLPKPTNHFQDHIHFGDFSCIANVIGSGNALNTMERNKKRKVTTQLWRPVSTQSNSQRGCIEKDTKTFPEIDCNDKSNEAFKVKHEHYSTSSSSVDILNASTESANRGPDNEQTELVTESFSALKSNYPSEDLEETFAFSSDAGENLSQSPSNIDELKSSDMTCKKEMRKSNVHELDITTSGVNNAEKYSTSIEVDASLIRFLKGKRDSKKKEIEEETGAKFVFPSLKRVGTIAIEGASTDVVNKASEKIKIVIEEAVRSPQLDYSHFISLPLAVHSGLVEKLFQFQNSIVGNPEPGQEININTDSSEDNSDDAEDGNNINCHLDGDLTVDLKVQDDKEHVKVEIYDAAGKNDTTKKNSILSNTAAKLGIDRSIFIKPKTFHLTILMLKLWNRERLEAATEVLQSISSKVNDALDGRPVFVKLKGLECMRGSIAKARVLYAPVEEVGGEDRLLRACQVIIEAYANAGLVLEKDAHQKLKLHATLMNVRHRKRKKRRQNFASFDARDIYKQYGSEEWGAYLIQEAHLSERFSFDDNGYYHCCSSIPFPERVQTE